MRPFFSYATARVACAIALVVLSTSAVHAACPNGCEVYVSTVVEPELECLDVSAGADDCDCGFNIHITNNCASPVVPEFNACGSPATGSQDPCPAIEPGARQYPRRNLDDVGTKEWEYPLSIDGEEHTIRVVSNVKSFEDEGCQMAPGASGSGAAGMLTVAGLLLALAIHRRRASI